MTVLKGPAYCAECDGQFTRDVIEAGGSYRTTVTIKGHVIPVPGLYTCTGCHEAIQAGARQSRVAYEDARDYLDQIYGPAMTAELAEGGELAGYAYGYMLEAAEVSALLEAVIILQGEPGGLDFLPECEGNCGMPHPRELAHLN